MKLKVRLPEPHQKQLEVLESNAKYKVICSGRRSGKSAVAQIIAIERMLKGQHIGYVAPTFGQCMDFFRNLLKLIPASVIKSINKSELRIEVIKGGTFKCLSGEALDSFRGKSFHYIIVDEAAHISDLKTAWSSSMEPTLSDYDGDALFISTPLGKNYFYSLYQKGLNGDDGFESFHFPTSANPYIKKSVIDRARLTAHSEAVFNQEWLAIPGENADNPFGVSYVQSNTIQSLYNTETVVYGIDVAKVNDYTVIVGLDRQGNQTYFERFRAPWEVTFEAIQKLPASITKIIDTTGVGDVIYERCQYGNVINIEGYKFTNESKTKIIYELIKDVEGNVLKFNQVIADEMMVYEYKYSKTGLLQFNAQAGYNDDAITALALANHKRREITYTSQWRGLR